MNNPTLSTTPEATTSDWDAPRSFADQLPADRRSNRKPFNHLAGYKASRIFQPTKAYIVIYIAAEQDMIECDKYMIMCERHCCNTFETSMPRARIAMKFPDFCEECMNESGNTHIYEQRIPIVAEVVPSASAVPVKYEVWKRITPEKAPEFTVVQSPEATAVIESIMRPAGMTHHDQEENEE